MPNRERLAEISEMVDRAENANVVCDNCGLLPGVHSHEGNHCPSDDLTGPLFLKDVYVPATCRWETKESVYSWCDGGIQCGRPATKVMGGIPFCARHHEGAQSL